MTFDDGILKIYRLENTAQKGDMPSEQLIYISSHYFGYGQLGIKRYYIALSNKQQIECVVNIHFDNEIKVYDIVEDETNSFFRIAMIQHDFDDDGLRYTKLSLERLNDDYKKIEKAEGLS